MGLSYFYCHSCHSCVCECYRDCCICCGESEYLICDDCTSSLPNICNKHICYHCLFNFFDENNKDDEEFKKNEEKEICEKYNITEKEFKEQITKAKKDFLKEFNNAEREYIRVMENYTLFLKYKKFYS